MARASGTAMRGLLQGGFFHATSGARYKVFAREGKVWMSYKRDVAPETAKESSVLNVEIELIYLIG